MPNDELIAIARHAEAAGFHGIAMGDHVAVPAGHASRHPFGNQSFDDDTPFADPFTAFAAMAAATSTLNFVSYAYVLPMRQPLAVAKQIATASDLSGGRIALGAGAGWLLEEFKVLGTIADGRVARTDEMLDIISQVWANGSITHTGSWFDIPLTRMSPKPNHRIPIYVGGTSERALRRAARHDGWLGPRVDLDELARSVERVRVLRQHDGSTSPFRIFAVQTSPSDAEYAKFHTLGVTDVVIPLSKFEHGAPTTPAARLRWINGASGR